jgi:phosphoserine phosphatase RsbU/P
MARKVRFPIAAKLTIVVVAIITLTGLASAFSIIEQEREALLEQMTLRGTSLVRGLADITATLILDDKEPEIESAVAKVAAEEVVAFAAISSINGEVLSHSNMEHKGKNISEVGLGELSGDEIFVDQSTYESRPIISFDAPITFARHRLGTAHLGFYHDSLDHALASARTRIILIMGAALLLGSLAMIIVVSFQLRPMRKLREGASHFAKGDLNYRVQIGGHDEMGMLSDSYNEMAEQLELAQEQIIQNRMLKKEIEIAREIQKVLLPARLPLVEGAQLAAWYESAQEVGGDYYDYFEFADGRLGMLIADISGKGIPAALVMAQARAEFRQAAYSNSSARGTLIKANRRIISNLPDEMFLTALYAIYDPKDNSLRFASAGHTDLVLVRAGGKSEVFETAGMAVGIDEGVRFEKVLDEKTATLATGDVVFMYTDGINEQTNSADEMFGDQRAVDLVVANRDQRPEQIGRELMTGLTDFRGSVDPADDVTFILLKVD